MLRTTPALAVLLAMVVARAQNLDSTPAIVLDKEYDRFCGAMDSQETCLGTRCCGWDLIDTTRPVPCYARIREDRWFDNDWTTVCVVGDWAPPTASPSTSPTLSPTASPTPLSEPPTMAPVPTTAPPTASPTTKSPTAAPTSPPTVSTRSPTSQPTQSPTASKDAPPALMLAVSFVVTFDMLPYETLDHAGFISSFQDDISREFPGVSRDDVVVRSITAGSTPRAMSSTVVEAIVRFRDDGSLTDFFTSAVQSKLFSDWFITAYAPAAVAEVQPVAVLAPTDSPTRGPLMETNAALPARGRAGRSVAALALAWALAGLLVTCR